MRTRAPRLLAAALVTFVAGSVASIPSGTAAPPGGGSSTSTTTYSGHAQVVDADLTLLGAPINVDLVHVDLPPEGGLVHDALLTVGDPAPQQIFLLGEVASAASAGSGNESDSFASVLSVILGLGNPDPDDLVITAGVLQSFAQAQCQNGQAVTSGSANIAELTINGQPITIAAPPNTTIDVPMGDGSIAKVILNEQIQTTSPDGRYGEITVNALHVTLLEGTELAPIFTADVIVSQAQADIRCAGGGNPPPPPPPCPVKDWVTGGGWIDDGGRVTFSNVGGQKPNGLSGHLNVVDHASGDRIRAFDLQSYEVTGPTTRRLTFTGELNGQPTTIVVDVADNGEPGTADTFHVSAGSYERSGTLSGGNIQLHQPKSCQTKTTRKR